MFCESLAKHKMEIINFKKRKMIPLTNKEYKSYLNQTNSYLQKKLRVNALIIKSIVELETIDMILVNKAHSIYNLKFVYPKKFLSFFILDQTMILFYLKRASERF